MNLKQQNFLIQNDQDVINFNKWYYQKFSKKCEYLLGYLEKKYQYPGVMWTRLNMQSWSHQSADLGQTFEEWVNEDYSKRGKYFKRYKSAIPIGVLTNPENYPEYWL